MHSFTFSFDYKNSSEFGIYANSYDIIMPPKRERRRTIPFRHGSHVNDNAYFNDRILRLNCFWLSDKLDNLSRAEIREITLWLSARSRLILDVEPDKYYVGELYNTNEFRAYYDKAREDIRTLAGHFELDFVCEPFAYGETVIQPISFGNNGIDYRGTAEAPTLIILRNTGSTPINTIMLTATTLEV